MPEFQVPCASYHQRGILSNVIGQYRFLEMISGFQGNIGFLHTEGERLGEVYHYKVHFLWLWKGEASCIRSDAYIIAYLHSQRLKRESAVARSRRRIWSII